MKGKWIRKVAVLLSLCLILNSGLTDLAGYAYVYAASGSSDVSTVDNEVASAEVVDLETEEEKENEDGEEVSSSDHVSESSESENEQEEAENTSSESDEEGMQSSEATSTEAEVQETESTTEETESVTATEEETTTEEATTEPETEADAIMPLADETASEVSVPADAATFLAQAANNKEFYIHTTQDFINVQELCKDSSINGFEGITFKISTNRTGTESYWDTAQMTGFEGIGTSEHPFKGTMTFAFAQSSDSTHLRLDRPLFNYVGDGAIITNMKIVANGCCSPIAENIVQGEITISDIAISGMTETAGTIGNGDATSIAGTIAGTVWGNANVMVDKVVSTADINAKTAGGIVGVIYEGATITLADDCAIGTTSDPITVKGVYAVGGLYGSAAGNHTIDITIMDKVCTEVIGNNAFAGQLAGILPALGSGTGTLTVTGGDTIEVNVTTESGATVGGLIGACLQNTKLVLPEPFTITGTVNGGSWISAGVVGHVEDTAMELSDITVEASVSGGQVGGIFGKVKNSKLILDTMTVSGTLTASNSLGGILNIVEGDDTEACAVELQGKITVTHSSLDKSIVGSVVYQQVGSLVYLQGIQGMDTDGSAQLSVAMDGSYPKYSEICTGSGLFRNQDMGNSVLLIGDGTLENVGKIHNTITGGVIGESGETDAAADLETFTIVNYTDGYFGAEAFGKTKDTWKEILAEDYTLYNNADISYEKTGIFALNRNDKVEEDYAFSGSLSGNGKKYTITHNYNQWQERTGVFSSLGGDTEFSNLIITGTTYRPGYAGGLAYRTCGTGLKLTDVEYRKVIRYCGGYSGGLVVNEEGSERFKLEAENIVLASTVIANDANFSGFITNMTNADVNIKNVTLGGSLKNSTNAAGGFLGKSWEEVGGTIDGITVTEGTSYTTNGVCGALLHTASSQNDADGSVLTMKDVKLAGLSMTLGGQGDSSLLIHNGQQLALELIDYSANGATVSGAASDFDEVVAYNVIGASQKTFGVVSLHNTTSSFPSYHYENQATYTNGTPTMNDSSRYYYDVFQKIADEDADGNRTPKVVIGKEGDYYVIDSPDKYYLWDVVQCCGGNERLEKNFKAYFMDEDVPGKWGEKYYFDGKLDLTNYSVYPVPRQGQITIEGRNAEIVFDADGKNGWSLPIDDNSQHCMMHCGLLYDTYDGNSSFKNLTFSGSIACHLNYRCGVLIAGRLLASTALIEDITLNGLYVSGYADGTTDDKASLLIGQIPASAVANATPKTVSFDGITMTGYTAGTQVGASLICMAGGEDATNLVLNFHDMKIEGDDRGDSYGTVLKYSSFIYRYDYTDDATINTGSGIYLFSEADEDSQRVTYGEELDVDTEYSDTTNKVLSDGVNTAEGKPPVAGYIPYIYERKDIEVNPKSGDILKGCGTYEDPYIIETTKQFLTLYRYINEPEKEEGENYQYQTFYTNWKMIKTGDDSTFCSDKHRVSLATDATAEADIFTPDNGVTKFTGTGKEDARVFGNEDFPTPEQLSRAYYQLGEDIDLSTCKTGTYGTIAEDFVGFGTFERPFTGVWYGKDDEDSSIIHTVTLPNKKADATYKLYGFIQYAQGAVIKDMNITANTTFTDSTYDLAHIASGGISGSVIACVLGGDNIIDNVKTTAALRMHSQAVNGGYVGSVRRGGLIFRNLEEADFAGYSFKCTEWGNNPYWGAMVGKVEDGYVLYENSNLPNIESTYAVGIAMDGSALALPAVIEYTILNGNTLKTAASQNGGLQIGLADTVAGSSTHKNVTITLPNVAALQIMAMALNANALNVCPSNYKDYTPSADNNYTQWGYSEQSRSRKANYSDIGCASATTDYLSAAKYDNANKYSVEGYSADKAFAYPYLYNYLGIENEEYLSYITTVTTDTEEKVYSILNLPEAINGTTYHVHWELAENATYDLREYKDAFRGIGAMFWQNNYVATFHGSFDGKGSNIAYSINRDIYWDGSVGYKTEENQKFAGFFNILYAPILDQGAGSTNNTVYNQIAGFGEKDSLARRECYYIQNFNLCASIENTSTEGYNVDAGGVVGTILQGNYVFYNINTYSADANTAPISIGKTTSGKIRYFGGIIGAVNQMKAFAMMQNVNLIGTEANPVFLKGNSNGGGFVGYSKSDHIKFLDCTGEYLTVQANGNAGGLLGYEDLWGTLIIQGSEQTTDGAVTSTPTSIKNSKITGSKNAGGFVGKCDAHFKAYNLYGESNTTSAYCCMGGVVGALTISSTYTRQSTIEKVTIKKHITKEVNAYDKTLAGMGGILGKNQHTITIKNVAVIGTEKDHTGDVNGNAFDSVIAGYNNKSRTGSVGAGGIIGAFENPLGQDTAEIIVTLDNCDVSHTYVSADSTRVENYVTFAGAGGIIGYVGGKVLLTDTVEDGLTKTISTDNLKVETQLGSQSVNDELAAGGCFGIVRSRVGADTTSVLTYAQGITAKNNLVISKYAGGFIGRLDGDKGETRVQGVQITDGTVTSDEAAGGLVGFLQAGYNGAAFNANNAIESDSVNLVSDMTITGRTAGGAFGSMNILNGSFRAENITVQDSEIIATADDETIVRSAGGLVGELVSKKKDTPYKIYDSTVKNNAIVCETATDSLDTIGNYATGGLLGRTVSVEGNIQGELLCDMIQIHSDNRIGIRKTGDTSETAIKLVKLVNNSGELVDSSGVIMPKASDLATTQMDAETNQEVTIPAKNHQALAALEAEYGYCVGSIIGSMDAKNVRVFVMASDDINNEEFQIPVMDYNPPVTDVGRNNDDLMEEVSDTYYQYRGKSRIIYGAPVTERDNYLASDAFKDVAYMKARIDEVDTEYTDATELKTLLTNYRISTETVELFKNTYGETYTFPGATNTVGPILVFKPENGTLQKVLECMTDVMTNVAGASASDIKTYLKIDCQQMLVDADGNITAGTAEDASVSASIDNGQVTYTLVHEDGLTEDGNLTYTEITYTYTYKDWHEKVFKIPVFVEEPVYYGVHTKIMEGSVISVDDIRLNGVLGTAEGKNIVIANDSDYTLLMEYAYGSARLKMPQEVTTEKSFLLKSSSGEKKLAVGTKLRLVDVTHGNTAYYYTVTDSNVTEVKFSDFTDRDGNPYVNQPICELETEITTPADGDTPGYYTDLAGHQLTDTGIERYLLTVYNEDTSNMAYEIHTTLTPQVLKEDGSVDEVASESTKSQFAPFEEHEKLPWFFVTAVPGLEIYLKKVDNLTDIDGNITKEDSLTVKATYILDGDSMYWEYMDKDGLDSENNGKFLEIGFYLRDEGRVNLPEGTNVSYVTGTDEDGNNTYSDNKIIQDNTVVYYYKDILEIQMLLDDLIEEGKTGKNDVEKTVEFKLNFAGADLSELTSGSYEACIELLRTADSEYPMGSGNTLDIYTETIKAQSVNNLGFAIQATDVNQLAINTYPAALTENTIDYQTMFDFSDILEKISGVGEEAAIEKWAGFDYEVTYQLYKKTENGENVVYSLYGADEIKINVTDKDGEKQSSGGKVTAIYSFGADEIKSGTDGKEGLIIRDGNMSIATADLVGATQDNLTNYKIIATLKIKDSSADGTDSEQADGTAAETTDFFVFTVTKLKTDLSE